MADRSSIEYRKIPGGDLMLITRSDDERLVSHFDREDLFVDSLRASLAREEAFWQDFAERLWSHRNVDTPCAVCRGTGVRVYPSTATWAGGGGGQALTSDVCDACWGTGDKIKIGADLRAMRSRLKITEEERDAALKERGELRYKLAVADDIQAAYQREEKRILAEHDAALLRAKKAEEDAPALKDEILRLDAQLCFLRGELEHIREYWNGNENPIAMADALYHTEDTINSALSSSSPCRHEEDVKRLREAFNEAADLIAARGDVPMANKLRHRAGG